MTGTIVTRRRPWLAALISLLVGPFLGMLHLNRGRLSLLYLGIGLVATVVAGTFFPIGPHTTGWIAIATFPINIVGAVHGYLIARNWNAQPLRWYAHWYSLVGFYLLAPALALTVRTFLYQPFNAPTTSMSPTINNGDYFFVEKFTYAFSEPQRGDVIVFRVPTMRNESFVKRIVGLPGDRIQMKNGILFVNGKAAPQRPDGNFARACGAPQPCITPQLDETLPGGRHHEVLDIVPNGALDNTPAFEVGQDYYFVMGDNRDNSNDSRSDVGLVRRDAIIGRVKWKFAEHGHWTWQVVE